MSERSRFLSGTLYPPSQQCRRASRPHFRVSTGPSVQRGHQFQASSQLYRIRNANENLAEEICYCAPGLRTRAGKAAQEHGQVRTRDIVAGAKADGRAGTEDGAAEIGLFCQVQIGRGPARRPLDNLTAEQVT